jgi:hypothetical protein
VSAAVSLYLLFWAAKTGEEKAKEEGESKMKFGEALELCRQGKRIHRTGWNGKSQFVYYQEGCDENIEDIPCFASPLYEWMRSNELETIEFMGHFDIYTEQKVVQCGWLASQGDMQAADWEVLE